MCGIYGSTIKYSQEVFEKKMQIFKFRGPDYTGIKHYDHPKFNLTLGHSRLAIIDLGSRANQPFQYNENISVVLNGEIYNFLELKKQYFSDMKFVSTSDTEVLCAMYDKFGQKCVDYFNGDFAFVIYDKRNENSIRINAQKKKRVTVYYSKTILEE